MEELIKIDSDGRITARELYKFLDLAEQHFARWAKQNISDNCFAEEGTDWLRITIRGETPTGGTITRDDYRLTIAFAKKLCMLSKTKRGEEARNYFLEVERRFHQIALLGSENSSTPLLQAAQLLAALELRIQQLQNAHMENRTHLEVMSKRIDNLDAIKTEGDLRQRLNQMVMKYARGRGILFHIAWREFKQAFNAAYHTNIELLITNFEKKTGLKRVTAPAYLAATNKLADGVRVADQLLQRNVLRQTATGVGVDQ